MKIEDAVGALDVVLGNMSAYGENEGLPRYGGSVWMSADRTEIHIIGTTDRDVYRPTVWGGYPVVWFGEQMQRVTGDHVAEDGTIRRDHYGPGRQPFDDIVAAGWAPAFAAGNILKYLRRTKEPAHSLDSARWYYERLVDLALGERTRVDVHRPANVALNRLVEMLTIEEVKRLTGSARPAPSL